MVVRPLIGYFRWSLSDPSGPTLEYVKSINTTYLAQIGLRPPPLTGPSTSYAEIVTSFNNLFFHTFWKVKVF